MQIQLFNGINSKFNSINCKNPQVHYGLSYKYNLSCDMVKFTSRKEYDELSKEYDVRASSHFRRGRLYGIASDDYKDVEDSLRNLYDKKDKNKILVIGTGNGEEPFSIAASTYSIKWYDNLKDVLDMDCVDLGPELTSDEIESASKLRYQTYNYATDSIRQTNDREYKFKDEICDFMNDTFKNKTKWDTSVQEFLKDCPENMYDCVSCNNVFGYIEGTDTQKNVVKQIGKIIKPDGILITDILKPELLPELLPDFKEFKLGIYKKDSI